MKKILLSIAAFGVSLSGQAQPTFAVDCVTSNPVGFVRCLATSSDAANKLKTHDPSKSFFIVFEGNQPEWDLGNWEDPTLTYVGTDKMYQSKSRNGNVAENMALPLTSVNSDLSSTFTDNLLWISQNETNAPGWPLNKTVQVCRSTTLTISQGIKLLRDKYHMENIPTIKGQDLDQVLCMKSDATVTVRHLLTGILRSYVAACYAEGYYKDSLAAFQVKGFDLPSNTESISMTSLTLPRTD